MKWLCGNGDLKGFEGSVPGPVKVMEKYLLVSVGSR